MHIRSFTLFPNDSKTFSATNLPEQLRKSRRNGNFDVDKQIGNKISLQSRPMRYKSRDPSVTRDTKKTNDYRDRGDNYESPYQNSVTTMSPAFIMSDKGFGLFFSVHFWSIFFSSLLL